MKVSVCFFVIFIALCLGNNGRASEAECDTACEDIYSPVCCTYPDGSTVTYDNFCEASVDSCKRGTKCVTIDEGCCPVSEPECPEICPLYYSPVCCTYPDGTTVSYDNSCLASADNCKRGISCTCIRQGVCPTDQSECPEVCPYYYDPVCCTYANGTTATYGNSCEAVAYNCPRRDCCVITQMGECSMQTEPAKCPDVACTAQYDPICCYYADGTSTTFGNSCVASVKNCQERKCCVSTTRGECRSAV